MDNNNNEKENFSKVRKSQSFTSSNAGTLVNKSTSSLTTATGDEKEKIKIDFPKPIPTAVVKDEKEDFDKSGMIDLNANNDDDKKSPEMEEAYFFPNHKLRLKKTYVLIAMTCMSYMTIGINDSAVGALLPQMQEFYNSSESTMSFCFLANFGGYLASTASSSFLVQHLPLRVVLMASSLIYCGGSLIGTFAPPFPALIVSLFLTGFGGGLLDTAATSVIVHFEDGPLLTYTYAFFSIGSMISPFIVGGLRQTGRDWNLYFWFPFALTASLFILQWFTYKGYQAPVEEGAKEQSATKKLMKVLSNLTVISAIILFFAMMALQDCWSQWASKFLENSKGFSGGIPQISQACFWVGVILGRLLLAHFISKWGDVKSSLTLTVAFACALTGFWKVDNEVLYGAIILNILLGFVGGPLVPLILSTSVETLPHSLKQAATSIIICGGLIGSTIMPMALGQAIQYFSTDIIPGTLIVMTFFVLVLFLALFACKRRYKMMYENYKQKHHNQFSYGSLIESMGLRKKKCGR